ncbi:MAG: MaoC family dehydratase, partial [Albidovulum sp.]|nr:MaoC family dehydratase [Albidovulum sp.]
ALYSPRHAAVSSREFARSCGLVEAPIESLAAFHTVFGKSVPDVSVNAIANLGYAEGRFFEPLYPGDTVRTESTVVGLKENRNRASGIVWVRTRGIRKTDEIVIEFVRWVMVRKRDTASPAPETCIPELDSRVAAESLHVPRNLDFSGYDFDLAGEPYAWDDYAIGERIDHADAVTVEDAEHMMATRLWQNTARVHFDATLRDDRRRLIYGGHVISLARSLSFNGLANAQFVAAINGGTHANPCFAGDTVRAWSEILDKSETERPSVGALRLRTVASNGEAGQLRDDSGKYNKDILLDLDYWVLIPR